MEEMNAAMVKTLLAKIERLERDMQDIKGQSPKSTTGGATSRVAVAAEAVDKPGSRELAGLLDPHLPPKKRNRGPETSDNGAEKPPPPPAKRKSAPAKAKKAKMKTMPVPCQFPTGVGNGTCGVTKTPKIRYFYGLVLCNACGLAATRGEDGDFGTEVQRKKWAGHNKARYGLVRHLSIRNNPAHAGAADA